MLDIPFPILVPSLVVIGLLIIGIARKSRQQFQTNNLWKEFADENGLQSIGSGSGQQVHLIGDYKGIHVTISTEERYSNHYKHEYRASHQQRRVHYQRVPMMTFIVLTADVHTTLALGLTLKYEDAVSRRRNSATRKDLQIGHEQIDNAFQIQCTDERATKCLLKTPEVTEALLSLRRQSPGFHLSNGILSIEFAGRADHFSRVQLALEQLVECATIVNKYAGTLEHTKISDISTLPSAPISKSDETEGSTTASVSDASHTENHW